jgi:hypothetical protein
MEDFEQRWINVEFFIRERFGKKPDIEAILYLIGINELGAFPEEKNFTKEQKQDLMHIAVCKLLSQVGIYVLDKFEYILQEPYYTLWFNFHLEKSILRWVSKEGNKFAHTLYYENGV